MAGHVTSAGVFAQVGAALLPLPATDTPLVQWAAEVTSLPPCIHCGARWGCNCQDWLEWMWAADNDRRAREAEEAEYVA